MNAREKKMAFALVGVLGLSLFAAMAYFWFVVPFKANRTKIASMTRENDQKQDEIEDFKTEQTRLFLAKAKSLPANANEASAVYVNYLETVFRASGMHLDEVVPSQNSVEVKPVSNIPNIKKTGHRTMTFTARAKGTLAQLVNAMERMRKTPFEHRIKSLTIDRFDTAQKDPNAKLIINMTLETLLVGGTANKPGVPPGVDVKCVLFDSLAARTGGPVGLGQAVATILLKQAEPAPTDRVYADIAKRNFFVGAIPKPPPGTKKKNNDEEPPIPPPSPPGPIPSFIRLVQVESNKEEAFYLNLFYRKDEHKISARADSGYNTFLVASDDLSYTFFLAKVLKIEDRDVFFQVKDKVFQWHVGDTLEHATKSALSVEYMDAIDLDPDYTWGKKELEKDKPKEKGKQPPRKGGKTR